MKYFDHNATTPVTEETAIKIHEAMNSDFGNPSSSSHELGRRARKIIDDSREKLAELVGAKPEEIIFTSGGTEASFSAIAGCCSEKQMAGRSIAFSNIEHPCVKEAALFVAQLSGSETIETTPKKLAELDFSTLSSVSLMLANNETGVINDLKSIFSVNEISKTNLFCDATQAVGKIYVSFNNSPADLMCLSAHKFGGPKGIGALLVKDSASWNPVIKGGGQEDGRRGGTEAVALIAGLGEAASIRKRLLSEGLEQRLRAVRDCFEQELLNSVTDVKINCTSSKRLPNTSSAIIGGTIASNIIERLVKEEIIIAAGSACKTGNSKPSHVLKACGLSDAECYSTVRVSFGPEHSEDDAKGLVTSILKAATAERKKADAKLEELLNSQEELK